MNETEPTDLMLPEVQVLLGDNPFDVDPLADLLVAPRHDLPEWSETMFFLVWDPRHGVGVWLHVGTVPEDKTLWWAQTFAMLPDGVVLADRSFGRTAIEDGPDTGNLKIRCVEPGRRWSLVFDGAGEKTTSDALGEAPAGAGVALPFSFEIELEAVVPIYDMHRAIGAHIDWDMGKLHLEQGLRATGSLTVPGQRWDLDGVAVRDHSRGERNFSRFGGHVWNHVVWPRSKRALCAFVMWRPGAQPHVNTSVMMLMEEGRTEVLSDFTITGSTGNGGRPYDVELHAVRADGSILELHGELEHSVTMTYVEPNHNLNGNWSADEHGLPDPLVANEAVVRWTWPDGDIGYGNLERAFRRSIMPQPVAPMPPTSRFIRTDG